MPAEPHYLSYLVCFVYDQRAGRKQVWGGDPMALRIHDHIHTSRAPPAPTPEFALPHLFPPFSVSET